MEDKETEGSPAAGHNRGVVSFDYRKIDGSIERRTIFIINENIDYIRGLDFKYLDDEEKNKIIHLLADTAITDMGLSHAGQPEPIEGFQSCWKKAWRTYRKSCIRGGLTAVDAPVEPPEEKI